MFLPFFVFLLLAIIAPLFFLARYIVKSKKQGRPLKKLKILIFLLVEVLVIVVCYFLYIGYFLALFLLDDFGGWL